MEGDGSRGGETPNQRGCLRRELKAGRWVGTHLWREGVQGRVSAN